MGVGLCKAGTQTCKADGSGYGGCVGEVLPALETCNTPGDDDCDGMVNEDGMGCSCAPGSSAPCYTGPMGTMGIGVCKAGTAQCLADGTGYGTCIGEILPSAETCNTPVDDDCNGMINEGGAGCVCVPGSTAPCYEGPPGTENVGMCKGGTKTCLADGTGYDACQGQIVPSQDNCGTPDDEDCNGTPYTCTGVSEECYPLTGQCIDACSPVLLGKSYQGCEYYPTVTANLVNSAIFHFSVAVSNTSNKTASITVTKGAATVTTATVAPNSVQILNLPWDASLKGPSSNSAVPMPSSVRVNAGAYRLVSNRPVTVYQYSPLEYQIGANFSYTNDASLLLPKNAWSGNYRAIARHHFAGMSGFFTVTASEDNTTVTLTKGPQGGMAKTGVAGVDANGQGTVVMNRGDVIQIVTNGGASTSDPNDVTGELIAADKPVQVISGHQCTNIPDANGYCDHIEEAMFPIETIAKEYIVSSPLIAVNTPKANVVRLLAIDPNVTFTYDPPQAGAPTSIAAAGGWVEFQTSASFQITGSGRFQVAQYMLGQTAGGNAGDPAMAQAVATFQFRQNYLFHAPTNYSINFAAIIAPMGSTVTLDGAAVTGFTPVGATGFGVKHVQLSNAGNGNHTLLADAAIGVSVYGYGQYTSYWYPGGLDLRNFN